MDNATFDLASSRIKEFNELCSSVDLSLSALQEKIGILDESDIEKISRVLYTELPESLYDDYPILHTVCRNRNVTVEIMKYLMDTFPNPNGEWSSCKFRPKHAVNYETKAYLLNIACHSENCPSDVIMFLVEHYPPALKHLCLIDEGIYQHEYDANDSYIEGLPIHYYLARLSNIDIDIVKTLVEVYPQSLRITSENVVCYPIHALFPDEVPTIIKRF